MPVLFLFYACLKPVLCLSYACLNDMYRTGIKPV